MRLSRDDFRSKLEIISFLSRIHVHFEECFVPRAFVRFGTKRSSAGAFGFDDALKVFLKLRSVTGHLFATPTTSSSFFENYLSFFKAEPVFLA